MSQSLELIDQLIQMEVERDAVWKQVMIEAGKGHEAIGESSMLMHLRLLKELVEKEKPDFIATVGVHLDVQPAPQKEVEPQENKFSMRTGGDLTHTLHPVEADGGGIYLVHETELPHYPKDQGHDNPRRK